MPMFYGKRDPALAAPSLPPSFASSYSLPQRQPQALPDYDADYGNAVARVRPNVRRLADHFGGLPGSRVAVPGTLAVPSVLVQKIQSLINEKEGDGGDVGSLSVARTAKGHPALHLKPAGFEVPPLPLSSRYSPGPDDGPAYQGPEQLLANRLLLLSRALDHSGNSRFAPNLKDENPGIIPLELRSAQPDSDFNDDTGFWMDSLFDRIDRDYDTSDNSDAVEVAKGLYPRRDEEDFSHW